MALVQKVRAKLRRSETDVTKISIKPEDVDKKVVHRSLAKFEASLVETTEALQEDIVKAYEEISTLKQREKQTRGIIFEKDRQILELEELLSKVKSDKLKEENAKYQSSLDATKQFIHSLEQEVEYLTSQIKEMKLKSDVKYRKVKKHLIQTKQDNALQVFELKQENLSLAAEVEKLKAAKKLHEVNTTEHVRNTDKEETPASTPCGKESRDVPLQSPRSLLVLQLSEKIELLEIDNRKLKSENKKFRAMAAELSRTHPSIISNYKLPP